MVRDKASSRFAIEPRATARGSHVVLRGREMPVFALRGALQLAAADSPQQQAVAGAGCAVELVGRSAEVGRLLSLMSMSRQGTSGQALLLTGGAGHGKRCRPFAFSLFRTRITT